MTHSELKALSINHIYSATLNILSDYKPMPILFISIHSNKYLFIIPCYSNGLFTVHERTENEILAEFADGISIIKDVTNEMAVFVDKLLKG